MFLVVRCHLHQLTFLSLISSFANIRETEHSLLQYHTHLNASVDAFCCVFTFVPSSVRRNSRKKKAFFTKIQASQDETIKFSFLFVIRCVLLGS